MPAKNVSFHPEAQRESEGARDWDAERSLLAARTFLTELVVAVDAVQSAPERYGVPSGTRRYHFPNFPFNLVYRVSGGSVIVIALAHHRRKPGYWLRRRS